MKIFITITILFFGMSLDMSAQATMSASKKMYTATPNVAQSAEVTAVRPTETVKITSSVTHRGADNVNESGLKSNEPTSTISKLRAGAIRPSQLNSSIVSKKKD